MSILTKGTTLALSTNVLITDIFVFEHDVYYLGKFTSREGLVARDLTDLPLLILCTDPDVVAIPDNVAEYAKSYIADKYGPK